MRNVAKGTGGGGSNVAMARVNARGEHVISVIKKVLPNPDGTTLVEAQISLDSAPVPERRYSADALFINYDRDGEALQFLFGQRAIGSSKLRSLVAIKVYPDNVRRFLKTTENFFPTLLTYLERSNAAPAKVDALTEEPAHVVSLVSNVIAAAYSGRESVIDFYHFNALSVRKLNEGSELAIDPVVRVDLPTTLLAGLVQKLNNLIGDLPPETL